MANLFQCLNPDCSGGEGLAYVFESNIPVCPLCKAKPPEVGTVVHMHFAYYDKAGDLIGYKNRKAKVACGARNYSNPFNCITPYVHLVNCPNCRRTDAFKNAWYPNPEDLRSYYTNPNLTEEEKERLGIK